MDDIPKGGDPGHKGPDLATELAELRERVRAFARRLTDVDMTREEGPSTGMEDGPEALLREGQRLAHELRVRLGDVEARVERSIRAHPAGWVGGLLGAVGFGLLLGMILRRRD